jgi:hypothetical protein
VLMWERFVEMWLDRTICEKCWNCEPSFCTAVVGQFYVIILWFDCLWKKCGDWSNLQALT